MILRGLGIAVVGSLVGCGSGGGSDGMGVDAAVDAPAACPNGDLCLDVTMAKYAALAQTGGSLVLQRPGDTIIVVRTSATAAVALSAVCTHQGCITQYLSSQKVLYCPCHGAEFSMTGAVVAGPASVPVKAYQTSVAGNIITIVGA